MGRTIPSWRIVVEGELKSRWKEFQDTLRIHDREIFEDMTCECRRYASAAGAAAFPDKWEGMGLSILFAHHKAIHELNNKLQHISNLLETDLNVQKSLTPNPENNTDIKCLKCWSGAKTP